MLALLWQQYDLLGQVKQASGFIKPPLRFDRFHLSTPQKTKSISTLSSACQKADSLVPIIPLQKKKKRKIDKESKNTFWMGEKVIHNEITVLVFQFSSVFKWFVRPMSIEIDPFFSSVLHLTPHMLMKKTAWIKHPLGRTKPTHIRAV